MRILLLFVFLLASCAPAQITKLPAGTRVERNVAYGSHAKQVLDIYYPKDHATSRRPALFFIHGGGWTGMSKDDVIDTHCRRYIEQGFVVVNVEYRVASDSPAPAAVLDVRAAARWLLVNAQRLEIDTTKIVVSGNSAGGHLAMMAVLPMDEAVYGAGIKPAAIVNIYGIMDEADLLAGPNRRDYAVKWLGDKAHSTLPVELSPFSHLSADLPPVLTVHGDMDDSVPYPHALRLTESLRKLGVRAELITVPGGKHGFPPERWVELYPQIFAFLKTVRALN